MIHLEIRPVVGVLGARLKSIFLHVGLPRCASTLIETEFVYPGKLPHEALKRVGIKPLLRLYKELRRGLSRPKWNDVFCKRLREYHLDPVMSGAGEGDDVRGYFVTDEGLTHISDNPDEPEIFADRAAFCGKLFEGADTRVLMMVRNQVSYVESLYGLHVQNGGTKNFAAYYADFPLDRFDWLPVADAFAEAFGVENITVFPLEKALYEIDDVPYEDFVHALLSTMGVEDMITSADVSLFNPSMDARLLPAQVEINRTLDAETAKTVHQILCGTVPKERGQNQKLLSPDEAQFVRQKFADSNVKLFQRYMPKFSMDGYVPE